MSTATYCRYHKDYPAGKIFTKEEMLKLGDDWKDSPAKINTKVESAIENIVKDSVSNYKKNISKQKKRGAKK